MILYSAVHQTVTVKELVPIEASRSTTSAMPLVLEGVPSIEESWYVYITCIVYICHWHTYIVYTCI